MSKEIKKGNFKKEIIILIVLSFLAFVFFLFFYAIYINFWVMLSKEDGGDLIWMYWTGTLMIIDYLILAVSFYFLSWFLKNMFPQKAS
jgi:hypothetical protein